MKAILEEICPNLYRILGGACQENQLTGIRTTGGFAQFPILCQMVVDILGYPSALPTITEALVLGAAISNWRGIGKT